MSVFSLCALHFCVDCSCCQYLQALVHIPHWDNTIVAVQSLSLSLSVIGVQRIIQWKEFTGGWIQKFSNRAEPGGLGTSPEAEAKCEIGVQFL